MQSKMFEFSDETKRGSACVKLYYWRQGKALTSDGADMAGSMMSYRETVAAAGISI